MSSKTSVIQNTINDVYCRIKTSKIHGIGVFAIRDIPANINPFKKCHKSKLTDEYYLINKSEISKVPAPVKKMLEDFVGGEHKIYAIPKNGLNSMDITFYMNHFNSRIWI